MIWFLIAVRQEVKRIDNSVVIGIFQYHVTRDVSVFVIDWRIGYYFLPVFIC